MPIRPIASTVDRFYAQALQQANVWFLASVLAAVADRIHPQGGQFVVGSREFGRLVLVVAFALAFVLTVIAVLAVALWGDDASRGRVKDVLGALLPTKTLLLGAAVVWYFAGAVRDPISWQSRGWDCVG